MSNDETQLDTRPTTALGQIKAYLGNDTIKQRFADMLGKRSSAFTNSLINVVRNSRQLQNCTPDSIMSAAIIPATLNLAIEPTLGQAYIIAYKKTAVFQIGYKGVVQLCIRSGQYKVIHCSEIYADEIKSYNPITGHVEFNEPSTYKMRESGNFKNVVGHYAYFKLISGFEKADYMTVKEADAHARKYSQAYQYDLREGKKSSPWSTDPIPMGNKTVLLRLLKKFGIMSVEMRDAIVKDETFEAASEAMAKQIDAEQGSTVVDAEFENGGNSKEPKGEEPTTKKTNRRIKPKASKKKNEPRYYCNGENGPHKFDTPKISGTEGNEVEICPECFTSDIVDTTAPDFMKDE